MSDASPSTLVLVVLGMRSIFQTDLDMILMHWPMASATHSVCTLCKLLHDVYASIESASDRPIWVYNQYKLCGPVLVNNLILYNAYASIRLSWNMPVGVNKHYKICKLVFKNDCISQMNITFYATTGYFGCVSVGPIICFSTGMPISETVQLQLVLYI